MWKKLKFGLKLFSDHMNINNIIAVRMPVVLFMLIVIYILYMC